MYIVTERNIFKSYFCLFYQFILMRRIRSLHSWYFWRRLFRCQSCHWQKYLSFLNFLCFYRPFWDYKLACYNNFRRCKFNLIIPLENVPWLLGSFYQCPENWQHGCWKLPHLPLYNTCWPKQQRLSSHFLSLHLWVKSEHFKAFYYKFFI